MARPSQDSIRRLAVFLATVVVVVAGSTAAPLLTDRGPQEQQIPAYEEIVPERAPAEGQPELEPAEEGGLIAIDAGHVNRFDQDEIQPLVEAITSAGYRVEFISSATGVTSAVKRADGLVVIDPGLEYSQSEVAAVERFVDNGGRLVLVGEPPQSRLVGGLFAISVRTIRSQMDSLSKAFGIEFGEAYLFNTEENDGNHRNIFAATRGQSPLIRGVDRTAFYTATSVTAQDGQPFLWATPGTRMVRGDTPGRYPVAVRSGNVVALGDKTFMFEDNFNVVDNEQLTENLARFLISGNVRKTLADYPDLVGEEPTVRYTKVTFTDAAQTVANNLRDNGQDPTISLRRGARAPENADVLLTTYEYVEEHDIGADGLTVANGRVAVSGYESDSTGVITFHAPRSGIDLVVVVDGPTRVRTAANLLETGEFTQYLISDRSAVYRTPQTGPSTGDGRGLNVTDS